MRARLILSLTLVLGFAAPASAKVLIVANTVKSTATDYGRGEAQSVADRVGLLTNILDAFGASYDVIAPGTMKTEWARIGVVTYDFGTTAAHTVAYDAVIHANFTRKSSGTPQYAAYRPDSLSLAAALPLVPQLFIGGLDAAFALNAGSIAIFLTTATTCSLGVSSYETAGIGSGSHDEEGVYYSPISGNHFRGTQNLGHALIANASIVGKGYRSLLRQGTGPIGAIYNPWLVFRSDWDSTAQTSVPTADTTMLWMIANTHGTGTKPIICTTVGGGNSDGVGGLVGINEGQDVPLLLMALAALDSASGGKVFENKARLPLGIAITIDGLCARSAATNSGGIVPSDTSRFYATLDSINGLGVPVVFGVNIDSVATYGRDLQYAKQSIAKARFAPQGRYGLDTLVLAASGVAQRYQPTDAFRRYRNALTAVGPANGLAADTSLSALLTYSIGEGDSLWGAGRSSRFALPPDDDWSPYNLRAQQPGPTLDSVLYAYRKAGYKGIRINVGWDACRANLTPNNPLGFIAEQQAWRIPFGTVEAGDRLLLLGHNGGSTYGNQAFAAIIDSTVPVASDPPPTLPWYAAQRLWQGIFGFNQANLTGDPAGSDANTTGETQRARIIRISCQELAGPATDTYKATSRPGWWAIRQVVIPIRVINQLAGRSILAVQYPEDIVP